MKSAEQKRDIIRKAAFRCFRAAGYHDTTIDDVCQEAKISKGSFYWHYSSKQEVFIDILESWMREVVDELYLQFEDALRQEDYLTAITEAVTRETHRGRSIVPLWLEFGVRARAEPEIQVAISQFYRRIRSAITEILRPVLGDRLPDAELEAVAATIFGAYWGLMLQDLCDPQDAEVRDTVRRFMSALHVIVTREKELRTQPAGGSVTLPSPAPASPTTPASVLDVSEGKPDDQA